jgi:hypothetical protein
MCSWSTFCCFFAVGVIFGDSATGGGAAWLEDGGVTSVVVESCRSADLDTEHAKVRRPWGRQNDEKTFADCN